MSIFIVGQLKFISLQNFFFKELMFWSNYPRMGKNILQVGPIWYDLPDFRGVVQLLSRVLLFTTPWTAAH